MKMIASGDKLKKSLVAMDEYKRIVEDLASIYPIEHPEFRDSPYCSICLAHFNPYIEFEDGSIQGDDEECLDPDNHEKNCPWARAKKAIENDKD